MPIFCSDSHLVQPRHQRISFLLHCRDVRAQIFQDLGGRTHLQRSLIGDSFQFVPGFFGNFILRVHFQTEPCHQLLLLLYFLGGRVQLCLSFAALALDFRHDFRGLLLRSEQ